MMNKKYFFFVIMYIALSHALFGQYFDYVSLGYNTVEMRTRNGDLIWSYHYFLHDPQYSKLRINNEYGILETEHQNANGIVISHYLNIGEFLYFVDGEGYTFDRRHEIYRVNNGRLVYAQYGNNISRNIRYSNEGITVDMRGAGNDVVLKFFNIPEEELRDKVMFHMIDRIRGRVSVTNQWGLGMSNTDFEDILGRLTKTELAIFRNCLFALHEYEFKEQQWVDFMGRYFSRGFRSYDEAYALFTNAERNFLRMILECENR